MAGLAAGSLSPDTSSGSRGVFVNSREVYTLELLDLQVLPGMVYQGNYWMDAYGNVNSENSIFLFNLPGVVVQSREGPMRADGRSILTIL